MAEKRVSVRSIVFFNDSIALMHRLKDDKEYYVFPGGGLEDGETLEECAVREMIEEFGIVTKPIKKLFTYEDDKMIQHYMLSLFISGEFGSGYGEEFFCNNGFYVPGIHNLETIKELKLYPTQIKNIIVEEFEEIKKLTPEIEYKIKNVIA